MRRATATRPSRPTCSTRTTCSTLPLLLLLLLAPATSEARQDTASTLREVAAAHGLNADDYPASPDRLQASLLRLFTDLSVGRVQPGALGYDLSPQARIEDLPMAIERAQASGHLRDLAALVAPRWRAYTDLQSALQRYRGLAALPLDTLPTPVRSVREGEVYGGARALHARLAAEGDLAPGTPAPENDTLDTALVDGLRRFQARHGLEVDGILGANTTRALQVPLAARVRQIELALERLRWLSGYPDSDVLLVNVPMFRLWAWEAGALDALPVFTTRVIVGVAMRTPTPVFTALVNQVIFRPYWNVPRSIAVNEILPRARRDAGYLARNNYEIVQGDGDRAPVLPLNAASLALVASGTARIRQRPGPGNALGLLKFDFPNPYSVYMHDTPGRQLFERAERDLSHGCVRVDDPESLAEWVLRESGWFRQAIVDATQTPVSRIVPVRRPIRVFMHYATAAVNADGSVLFAEDLYKRDPVLDRALRAGQR